MITKQEQHLRNLATRHRYKIIKMDTDTFLLANENNISIGDPGTINDIEKHIDALLLLALEAQLRNANAPVTRRGNFFEIPDGTLLNVKQIKKWWNQRSTAGLRI